MIPHPGTLGPRPDRGRGLRGDGGTVRFHLGGNFKTILPKSDSKMPPREGARIPFTVKLSQQDSHLLATIVASAATEVSRP